MNEPVVETPVNDPIEEQEIEVCDLCECPIDECECEWDNAFSIILETEGSNISITKPKIDGTWMEILDTFWKMLQTVGFCFNSETQKKFENLLSKE